MGVGGGGWEHKVVTHKAKTYAYDDDHLTTDINIRNLYKEKISEILARFNLQVNESKTEDTSCGEKF